MKGFALGLALKQRRNATRKSLIIATEELLTGNLRHEGVNCELFQVTGFVMTFLLVSNGVLCDILMSLLYLHLHYH